MPPSSFVIDIVIEVFSAFELLILSLTLLMLWTYRYQRLFGFRQVNILHCPASFWCICIILSLSNRFLGPISIQMKNQMFGVPYSFSSCSCIIMSLKSDAIVKHNFFLAFFVLLQRRSVSFVCTPSFENRRMASVLSLPGFLEHLFRFEEHDLSFRCTMLRSSSGILLDDKARDRIEIVVVLLECCGTPRILQISPATAEIFPDFLKGIAIRTLKFYRILAKFEDLCVVHVDE